MTDFGAAWYPEHWPEERWQRDIDLMVAADFTVVRVAEFAWSSLEPADGQFTLDWLVRAVDLAHGAGLKVVIGTPTAAPPAWLTRTHPEILPVRDSSTGTIQPHGQRGHYDPTNATYRTYCARITRKLGEVFAQHPAVIGWQTDNEFWSIAENPSALADFRRWCLNQYGSLDALNEAWSTAYWSQTAFILEDIHPPREYPNPGLFMAWRRWASAALADFQRVQVDALRPIIPDHQWIGHNFHPYDDVDREPIAADLDLVSWDAYVFRPEHDRLEPFFSGRDADRIRDLGDGQRPFWIMETVPGFVNWRDVNRHLDPGESRTMAWHLIGHGADAVLYWQWRSAPGGQEQYHGCLLQQDGEPRPVYAEVASIGAELKRVSHLLEGSRCQPQIAVIDRWCDRTALERQRFHKDYDPAMVPVSWYTPIREAGFDIAVWEHLDRDLNAMPVIVAPQLHLVDDTTAQRLLEYIANGGHLILGPRALMKNEHNALRQERQPGPLAIAAGAVVDEVYSLSESISVAGTLAGSCSTIAEWWRPTADGVTVLATFGEEHPWLAGKPAVMTRTHGAGRITLCAGCPDHALATAVISHALSDSGLTAPITPPPAVEVCQRVTTDGQPLTLLINHSQARQSVPLPARMHDHLDQKTYTDHIQLEGYGVALLTATAPA